MYNHELDNQISHDARSRYKSGVHHSSKDLEGMSDVEHAHLLSALGNIQRGAPEDAVFAPHGTYAKLGNSGIYPWATEHTGDLYWRTNARRHHGADDIGAVENKISKVKDALNSPYGFKREMEENLRSNAIHLKDPSINWDTAVIVGKHYADEHDKLPVYNLPAGLMTQATRHLGNMNFGAASATLGHLHLLTQDRERWNHLHSRQASIDFLKKQGK